MASTVGKGSRATRCWAVPARRVRGGSAKGISPPLAPPAGCHLAGRVDRLAVEQDGEAGLGPFDAGGFPEALHGDGPGISGTTDAECRRGWAALRGRARADCAWP